MTVDVGDSGEVVLHLDVTGGLMEDVLDSCYEVVDFVTEDVSGKECGEPEVGEHLLSELLDVLVIDGLEFASVLLRGVEVLDHDLREEGCQSLLVQSFLVGVLVAQQEG